MLRIYFICLLLNLVGCQMVPPTTKVTESRQRDFLQVIEKTNQPLNIPDLAVVLDTRSRFDFGLNHVVNSQHFGWSNLAEREDSGELLRDLHMASLRLALMGLTPETPVVVVGYGPNAGRGEEGRLAWNLLYLGFQDVQVTGVEALRKSMTQEASGPAQNVRPWKASLRTDLQVSRDEFAQLLKQPKLRLDKNIHIIDVRSEKEYLTQSKADPSVGDIPSINIEWKNFYTASGRPDVRIVERLKAVGIQPNDRIVLISDHGVRSGAACYALLALGYTHAQNFTFGWRSLR